MATKAMTQTQLLRHLAESCQQSNKVVRQFVETLAETALKETKQKGLFILPGIGRLVKAKRKARMGRNPCALGGMGRCLFSGAALPVAFPASPFGFPLIISP